MALTRSFGETVKARLDREPAFRKALLTDAVERLIAGEVDLGKALLRDFIEATVGFEQLATDAGTPPEALARMLRPEGNPAASDLFAMLGRLQRASGVQLHVAAN